MKKKAAVLGLAIALVVLLYSAQASQTLRIEDRAWNMTLLLNGEGNVLACGPDLAEIYPDTEVLASLAKPKTASCGWPGQIPAKQIRGSTARQIGRKQAVSTRWR